MSVSVYTGLCQAVVLVDCASTILLIVLRVNHVSRRMNEGGRSRRFQAPPLDAIVAATRIGSPLPRPISFV